MTKMKPPATAEEFRTVLLERYDSLSKRLKQVARYVLDEPNELALETFFPADAATAEALRTA